MQMIIAPPDEYMPRKVTISRKAFNSLAVFARTVHEVQKQSFGAVLAKLDFKYNSGNVVDIRTNIAARDFPVVFNGAVIARDRNDPQRYLVQTDVAMNRRRTLSINIKRTDNTTVDVILLFNEDNTLIEVEVWYEC